MHLPPNQLAALAAVLRYGSFETAAASLHVTQSAISQRIQNLEERVGFILVERGAPCTGTKEGIRLAKHAEDLRLLERQALEDVGVGASAGPGRVKIAVNADSLATWFAPVLRGVDGLLIDYMIDDQDHSADWLRRGVISAAVTAANQNVPTCDFHDLGAMRYIATASPDFVEQWCRAGVTKETLSGAPMFRFNAKDGLQTAWLHREFGLKADPPSQMLPSTQAFVEAVLQGAGWGMNPAPLVEDHIRAGRLVALGERPEYDVHLSWQVTRALAPALIDLTRGVRAAARSVLTENVTPS